MDPSLSSWSVYYLLVHFKNYFDFKVQNPPALGDHFTNGAFRESEGISTPKRCC